MRTVYSNNITMVPASQLPFRNKWRMLANGLPKGSVLFVVPDDETAMKRRMRRVAEAFRARGRPVNGVSSKTDRTAPLSSARR